MAREATTSPTPASRLVLLAEDSADDAFLFRRVFESSGLRNPIHVVDSGDQAIGYLSGTGAYTDRQKHPLPGIVVLDLNMPKVNGFDVLEWMRKDPSLRNLLTIVLTGLEDVRGLNRAYTLGAKSFLTKPLRVEHCRQLVTAYPDYWVFDNLLPIDFRSAGRAGLPPDSRGG